MSWTSLANPAYVTGHVMTQSDMAEITNNLRYLKGTDGAVAIDNALGVTVNTNAAAGITITNSNAGSSAYTGLNLENDGGADAGAYRCSSTNTAYGGANSLNFLTIGAHPFAIGTNNVVRQFFSSDGKIGFGTTSPQSVLHAVGAGGGFMFLSANAVDGTLQTLAAAGTVTQSAAFWIYDRNNTGGAFVQASGNMLGLAQTFNLVNTDTVTVAVTAGGAITVQRTAGTNGTHQVNALILYK
jgi:hypothetical protein